MSDHWHDVIVNWSNVLTYVRRRGVPDVDVEDVAANGLYKCWHAVYFNARTFDKPQQFWSYFWICVRSAAIEYHREREVPRTGTDERTDSIIDGVPEPFDPPAQVRAVLAALPDDQRYALTFIVDRVPPREMARMTGWSMQTCHNVRRATWLKLRRAYAAAGENHELAISRKKGARAL